MQEDKLQTSNLSLHLSFFLLLASFRPELFFAAKGSVTAWIIAWTLHFCTAKQCRVDCKFRACHTCAKMIEIQKIYLQKIHGLHELGSRMECNDTLHGSELGPHWALGPKNSKFGPMGPNFLAHIFFYTKLFRYHGAIL